MRNKTTVVALLGISLCLHSGLGCAYVENRARDAADMVTVAVEFPVVGASAWGGPYGFGVIVAPKGYGFGLRSGIVGPYSSSEGAWTCLAVKRFETEDKRGKGYREAGLDFCHGGRKIRGGWFNGGQAEVAVGAGLGVRAGVNFIEIVDFAVGLVGIDICDDDIAGK